MQFMSYAPVIFISVKDKQRINQVIEMAEYVSEKRACVCRPDSSTA